MVRLQSGNVGDPVWRIEYRQALDLSVEEAKERLKIFPALWIN